LQRRQADSGRYGAGRRTVQSLPLWRGTGLFLENVGLLVRSPSNGPGLLR
jgi:hypothetical protein